MMGEDHVRRGTDPYLTLTQSYPTMFTVAILFMVLIFVLTDASAATYSIGLNLVLTFHTIVRRMIDSTYM